MNDTRDQRLHALDAVRGFALLLGVAFHAAFSFLPDLPAGLWFMKDNSQSPFLSDAAFVTHIFRMSLFFFIAGYFGRLLFQRLGVRGFCANRGKRILVPLIVFWVLLAPLVMYIWVVGVTKVFGGKPPPMPEMPEITGAFPLMHLWFLYQLLLIYVAVIVVRGLVARIDPAQKLRGHVDTAVTASIRTMAGVFTLGLPLAATLMTVAVWYYWQGIPTPEHSLIPQAPASVGFGTAFVFGWLVHRAKGALGAIEERWFPNLVIAIVATGWMLHTLHGEPLAQPGTTKTVFAMVFGVAVWGWVLGLTGAALRFLSDYSARRRYIADASYWIYLVHLPVIAALQIWVGHSPLHWGYKYPFILFLSFMVLFATYRLFVRSTFIGQLLNGRKYPRDDSPSVAQATSSAHPADVGSTSAVARLAGVTKRYGTNTALSALDIEVRSGELLALLGPNGAGKTTAIGLWLGLIEADAGEVMIMGGSPQDVTRRRRLGVMMQDVELVKELRVRELVALSASYYCDPMTVEEALATTGTTALANRPYGKLSGGQKRQVQFAVAICGRPRLLFLDEPTVGLDVQAREALWTNIRALLADGCSIVLTTHYLEEAEALATRVAVLVKGRVIASGSVDDMRSLVARRQISCESVITPETVLAWPGVADARRDRNRLLITATDAEGVVRRLLAADPDLRRLDVREAGLADAFNELTREAA